MPLASESAASHPALSAATRVEDGSVRTVTDGALGGSAAAPLDALFSVVRRALGAPLVLLARPREAGHPTSPDPGTTAGRGAEPAPHAPFVAALLDEVIRRNGPVLIEDTRTAPPPLRGVVRHPSLRALACLAVPLPDHAGAVHGALVALDGVPRWWTDCDAAVLSAAATAAQALLAPTTPSAAVTIAPAERAPRDPSPSVGHTLEAIGQLAGGVAHDFNNLLTVIAANAELLRLSLAPDSAPGMQAHALREVDEIERAASRASALTSQLLAFGQQLALDPAPADLHFTLGRLEPQIRALLAPAVTLELVTSADRPRVVVDVAHLERVVLALVTNACDAMPSGGVLRLHTVRRTLDAPLVAQPDPVAAGDWLVLSVQDTGVGLSEEQVRRLFEPFYTTKEFGQGRGLSLAAAYGIVAQSGGRCTVESAPGRGTTVQLWLPAT